MGTRKRLRIWSSVRSPTERDASGIGTAYRNALGRARLRPAGLRGAVKGQSSGGRYEPFSRLSRKFIGGSSPRATVEGARRSLHSACTTKLHYGRRVYLADPQAPSSGRRKIEAALEASLGSPDHKCTSFHLAPGGQLCLGYRRGGRPPSREPGTWRGKKSLTFEVNTALRFHSTHQATVPAIGGRMFF
jgi:hypothetical protein